MQSWWIGLTDGNMATVLSIIAITLSILSLASVVLLIWRVADLAGKLDK